METYETIEYRGFNININYDTDPMNPRTEWDGHLGTMVCNHRNYTLGDEQISMDSDEYMQQLAIEADPSIEDKIDHWENGKGWVYLSNKQSTQKWLLERSIDSKEPIIDSVEECDKIIKNLIQSAIDKHYLVLPLYLYDHSGITMNTSGFHCPWDSGQVGIIYASYNRIRKEFNRKKLSKKLIQKAIRILRSEVEVYDMYLTGEVFGYMIEPTDRNKSIECDDSCWGFFGYPDTTNNDMIMEAKSAIDFAIQEYMKSCIANHLKKMQINQFMKSCWAY